MNDSIMKFEYESLKLIYQEIYSNVKCGRTKFPLGQPYLNSLLEEAKRQTPFNLSTIE